MTTHVKAEDLPAGGPAATLESLFADRAFASRLRPPWPGKTDGATEQADGAPSQAAIAPMA
jgi:hypothetical protein